MNLIEEAFKPNTGLVQKLAALGIRETECNIANKVSRGGFTAAFIFQ